MNSIVQNLNYLGFAPRGTCSNSPLEIGEIREKSKKVEKNHKILCDL